MSSPPPRDSPALSPTTVQSARFIVLKLQCSCLGSESPARIQEVKSTKSFCASSDVLCFEKVRQVVLLIRCATRLKTATDDMNITIL